MEVAPTGGKRPANVYIQLMSSKTASPAHLARLEKRKIASEEGAQALAEQEARSIAVRQNMERLRALRLAKEAQEAAHLPAPSAKRAKAKSGGKSAGGKSTGGKSAAGKSPVGKKGDGKGQSQPLSAWLASQRDSGRLR